MTDTDEEYEENIEENIIETIKLFRLRKLENPG